MAAPVDREYTDVQVIQDNFQAAFFVVNPINQIGNGRVVLQDGHTSDNPVVGSKNPGCHARHEMSGFI
ncbi:MAG: hypothetical protein GWO41_09170, partial [candidate division Zixibacteria bacterium]|nr:hypothetical protein [candidate division Zixibacteria bacterium]